MRQFIFTEKDKRRLTEWLETGAEDQCTLDLFTVMRKSFPKVYADLKLLLEVRKRLQSENRWRGKVE